MKHQILDIIGCRGEIHYLVLEDECKVSGEIKCIISFAEDNKFIVVSDKKGTYCINLGSTVEIRIKKPKWINEKNSGGINYG